MTFLEKDLLTKAFPDKNYILQIPDTAEKHDLLMQRQAEQQHLVKFYTNIYAKLKHHHILFWRNV